MNASYSYSKRGRTARSHKVMVIPVLNRPMGNQENSYIKRLGGSFCPVFFLFSSLPIYPLLTGQFAHFALTSKQESDCFPSTRLHPKTIFSLTSVSPYYLVPASSLVSVSLRRPSSPLTTNMPVTQTPYQLNGPAVPISMPSKSPYYTPLAPSQPLPYSRISMSPTSAGSSVNTSAVPSLTSGSCAGSSCGEHENSSGGAGSIDLVEMMTNRLSLAIDPLPMDRSLAQQAQT